ncbi:efflux RND transporter periplasmic adaptor subunit [Aminobacterium sp. MB27-C1]|uniref:efflux RND transporter periplasmic adaptor subunit n=1 Tax=unclassified Aminobacterium TaxID=2685012 RepID=UPI001BCE32EE|nr:MULTISPECIES: efflux RND transporter periplasmic adaptor subunit [unclassified Aminobacterium]MEA4878346.1 efflux RND transporter periplasmic adaptor subunit [Aminobacterium sp.]WMI72313.1 efflux RND transporter periplasmic adaptor subunit [Aminobacterium sp. MB27-C1]
MRSTKKILIGVIVILLGAGFFVFGPLRNRPEASQDTSSALSTAAKVSVMSAKKTPVLRDGFEENSTIEAIERVVVYPKVTGRLESLKVSQGDLVQAGQTIAVLDHRDIDAQISSVKASIIVAEAQVAEARAGLDNAKIERERYQRLLKEGFSTQQQLDAKETAYLQTEARYKLAEATVLQARSELKNLEVKLSEYYIKAPISGTVLNDYSHTIGTMMSPSVAVVEIADMGTLKAVVRVPESRAFGLSSGMKGLVRSDGLGNKVFEGTIARVSPYVKEDTRTVQVEVFIDNNQNGVSLRPGMFARVFLIRQEAKDALVVPSDALIEGEEGVALRLVKDEQLRIIPVKLGIRTDSTVQVTEGLSEGDYVVVAGGKLLKDGDKVEFSVRE